jgi:hypothetical protein
MTVEPIFAETVVFSDLERIVVMVLHRCDKIADGGEAEMQHLFKVQILDLYNILSIFSKGS